MASRLALAEFRLDGEEFIMTTHQRPSAVLWAQLAYMRRHIVSFVLSSIWLVCFTCCGGESGEVLVVGFTNGVPVTQVGTNDYYRDKLARGLDKKTLDVQLDNPKDWR